LLEDPEKLFGDYSKGDLVMPTNRAFLLTVSGQSDHDQLRSRMATPVAAGQNHLPFVGFTTGVAKTSIDRRTP
jgi:hypothetical protein